MSPANYSRLVVPYRRAGREDVVDIEALRARADELMAQVERMRSGVGELQQ